MKHKKLKIKNQAVSEVLGTVLLLGISVTLFSVVYASVLSIPAPTSTSSATIVGTIRNNELILEHRGGDKIGSNGEIIIMFGDNTSMLIIGDQLGNGWNLGERITYNLSDLDLTFERFEAVEVMVVDSDINSVVMMGKVQEPKIANIEIFMNVPNTNPDPDENFCFNVTVTNKGPCDAEDIEVKIDYPNNVKIKDFTLSNTTTGSFNKDTGVLLISFLPVGESFILDVVSNLTLSPISQPTQLVMILDASTSISNDDWGIMKTGIAAALEDSSVFPHDGSVELTIIQFGGQVDDTADAQVELDGPTVITKYPGLKGYYGSIANQIKDITRIWTQGTSYTPLSCGIVLATDVLVSSPNYLTHRTIVNIVTDGKANGVYDISKGDYKMTSVNYDGGKSSAEAAREYLLDFLKDGDEIDVVLVGDYPDYKKWLIEEIVWPENETGCGYQAPPFNGPGWVRKVGSYIEFAETLKENFNYMFNTFELRVELTYTLFFDNNPHDNFASIKITPKIN